MTQDDKKIKSYVNAVERKLRIPLKMKKRVSMDLESDIHARAETGKGIGAALIEHTEKAASAMGNRADEGCNTARCA